MQYYCINSHILNLYPRNIRIGFFASDLNWRKPDYQVTHIPYTICQNPTQVTQAELALTHGVYFKGAGHKRRENESTILSVVLYLLENSGLGVLEGERRT